MELKTEVSQERRDSLNGLLDKIYISVCIPELWRDVIDSVAEVFCVSKVNVVLHDGSGSVLKALKKDTLNSEGSNTLTSNGEFPAEECIDLRIDCQAPMTGSSFLTKSSHEAKSRKPGFLTLTLYRVPRLSGSFSDHERVLCEYIGHHLCRALCLEQAFQSILKQRDSLLLAFDHKKQGVVRVDVDMRILFINPGLAKSLVYNTSPVTVTEGYLTLRCTKHQFELQRAVDYCVRDGVDRKLQCSFDSDQMLHLHVFRSADDDPETAILLIKPKNENLHFCYSLMKGRWHLSNRELELIVCFVEHPDLRHVSTELNISYETTRWHFKRILSKFDAKNQAELLARVFSYCLVPD